MQNCKDGNKVKYDHRELFETTTLLIKTTDSTIYKAYERVFFDQYID